MKFIISLFFLTFYVGTIFAQQDVVVPPLPEPEREQPTERVFMFVEEMPLFKTDSCGHESNKNARKMCTDMELMKFVYANLQYPKTAKESGIEGLVVVSFVVNKIGEVEDIKVLRSPHKSLGAEAMRVAALLRFHPGKQRGQPVAVRMNFPIRFRLAE